MPATTCSPTHFRVQYNRPSGGWRRSCVCSPIKKYEAGPETHTYENKSSRNVVMPMSKPQNHSANASEQARDPTKQRCQTFILSRDRVESYDRPSHNCNERKHFHRQDHREGIEENAGSRPASYQKREARIDGLAVTMTLRRHGNTMLAGASLGSRVPKVTGIVDPKNGKADLISRTGLIYAGNGPLSRTLSRAA
jgi:hypothetical protein